MDTQIISAISGTEIVTNLTSLLAANASNNVLIQGNENIINFTPQFDLSQIPFSSSDQHIVYDFVVNQIEARKIIVNYDSTQNSPLAIQSLNLSSVIGFCSLWNAYYQDIVNIFKDINNSKNKVKLIQGLKNLKNQSNKTAKNYVAIIQGLNNYKVDVENNNLNLLSSKTVFENYFNTKGEPLGIEKLVSDIELQMASDNTINANGASKQGLGVLIITLVVVAEIFKNKDEEQPEVSENSQKIIQFSVDMIKDDIKQQTDATKDWNDNFQKYQSLLTTLEYDKKVFILVNNFISAANNLVSGLTNSSKNETAIQLEWNNLGNFFDGICNEISQSEFSDMSSIISDLYDFNNSIASLQSFAISMQNEAKINVVKS